MQLAAHQPFMGLDAVIKEGSDILSNRRLVNEEGPRILVKDTNIGQQLQAEIVDLEILFKHYEEY